MTMSFANTPFPHVVDRLTSAGVHAYRADLIRMESTYYGEGRESHDSTLPLCDGPPIAPQFREADVVAAVRAAQRGEIGYADFLRRIMQAGCASYSVFIDGRKVMYFGRNGEFCTEAFRSPP
jgi:uncharacterized protein YbcV (DUF1398 family)